MVVCACLFAEILKHDVFANFYQIFPEKFQNKTNGVTPRRWLAFCNPPLRDLITDSLGTQAWISDLDRLKVRAQACMHAVGTGREKGGWQDW